MSAAGTLKDIPSFDPKEISLELYIDLFNSFISANGISEDERKKQILLSSVGLKVYSTLGNLCVPDVPSDKTFDEIIALLKQHYVTKPSYHRSLCLFQQR